MDPTLEINPCDATLMHKSEPAPPEFLIDGTQLSRGREHYDSESNRLSQIATQAVTVWSISENSYEKHKDSDFGHFYNEDSYIIRWKFRITITGRELSGKPSKYSQIGRDRCLYFLWLGKNASINEKGLAALLTIELDNENARQIRIMEGMEPPVFLQLFNGEMCIHSGKRDVPEKKSQRLYIIKGEISHETVLVEVPYTSKSLRSRGSFVFTDCDRNTVRVWHGSKSPENTKNLSKRCGELIAQKKSSHFGFSKESVINVVELNESKNDDFFGENGVLYASLLDCNVTFGKTPRLFHMSSLSGSFKAVEVLCPYRSNEETPFPFLQSDLYSVSQPGKFFIL